MMSKSKTRGALPKPIYQDKSGKFYKEYLHKQGHVQRIYGTIIPCGFCAGKSFVDKWRAKKDVPRYCSISCKAKATNHKTKEFILCHQRRKWLLLKGHPNATKNGRYIVESRSVMSEKLGRVLQPWEIVHHINEDVNDNRIQNLQLVTRSEHAKIHADRRQKVAIFQI